MNLKVKIIYLFIFFFPIYVVCQPRVITSKIQYNSSVKANPANKLLNIKKLIPNIILDLKYSTNNNFTKLKLYNNTKTTYLRYDAAMALLEVQNFLTLQGYTLKIFDAYRPYAVTKLMWNLIKDERYVANPKNGSGHNKGTSVDLTIVKISSNTELDMGTGFDNFTDTAHHSFTSKLNADVIHNRNLLKTTMEQFGFKSLETEWWHYSWKTLEELDVIDISFKMLKRLTK